MAKKINIIADNKIPFLKGVFEPVANILYFKPSEINSAVLKNADALITRTRTKCDSKLLEGTNVKCIATATIGFDHIDLDYCKIKNIKWFNAPGCNSSSVMQYMSSVFVTLLKNKGLRPDELTIGIIGVGNVGSKVAKIAKILGMNVLLNDPPRQRKEGDSGFVSLDELINRSDIITFHVPLNKDGIDKTYHMGNDQFFARFQNSKIIINTSRGSVIEKSSLKSAIKNKLVSFCAIDVWENEPEIDVELLNLVNIATPHIAGYSADGKANGTAKCVHDISSFFSLAIDKDWYPSDLPSPERPQTIEIECIGKSESDILGDAILGSYNILEDDKRLRLAVDSFEKQRNNYPVRREFPYYSIRLLNGDSKTIIKLLEIGFKIIK